MKSYKLSNAKDMQKQVEYRKFVNMALTEKVLLKTLQGKIDSSPKV